MIWRELRRRKVLRTCALYLVACWILIQASDVLIPVLGFEAGNIPRYLLYGGLLLFPAVPVFAWFFQVTPRGVRRSDDFAERRLLENIPPINDRREAAGVRLGKSGEIDYDWELTAESGPLTGLRYAVSRPLLIGRAKDCDLALVSAQVSRHHARVVPRGNTLLLEDLGSVNGTLVNGEPVQGQRQLRPGDVIRIKDISFRVSESFSRSRGEKSAMDQATVLQDSHPGTSRAPEPGA